MRRIGEENLRLTVHVRVFLILSYQINRLWSPSTSAAVQHSAPHSDWHDRAARSDSSALQWGFCTLPHSPGWAGRPAWCLNLYFLKSYLTTPHKGNTEKEVTAEHLVSDVMDLIQVRTNAIFYKHLWSQQAQNQTWKLQVDFVQHCSIRL